MMQDLMTTAERLRAAKEARRRFLALWALERLAQRFDPLQRLDVVQPDRRQIEQAVADPYNHDWSLLYRGSVLDD